MKVGKEDFNTQVIAGMTKADFVKDHINDFFLKETDLEKRKKLLEKVHDDCVAEEAQKAAPNAEAVAEVAAEVSNPEAKPAPEKKEDPKKAKPGENPEK